MFKMCMLQLDAPKCVYTLIKTLDYKYLPFSDVTFSVSGDARGVCLLEAILCKWPGKREPGRANSRTAESRAATVIKFQM